MWGESVGAGGGGEEVGAPAFDGNLHIGQTHDPGRRLNVADAWPVRGPPGRELGRGGGGGEEEKGGEDK